jgi:hypothetical protein
VLQVRAAAKRYAAAAAAARARGAALAAPMFSGGALYADAAGADTDANALVANAPAPLPALPGVDDVSLLAAAAAAGINLSDPGARAALEAAAAAELRVAAAKAGLNVRDPRVEAALRQLDARAAATLPRAEAGSGSGGGAAPAAVAAQKKAQVVPRALSPRVRLARNAAYALLAVRMAWQMHAVRHPLPPFPFLFLRKGPSLITHSLSLLRARLFGADARRAAAAVLWPQRGLLDWSAAGSGGVGNATGAAALGDL